MRGSCVETNNYYLKYSHFLIAFIIVAVLYLFFSVSGSLYVYSDNMTVSIVASGMYGNHFMCQYIHPLLNVLVRILTPALPSADVFAVLVHVVLFAGVYLMLLVCEDIFLNAHGRKWELESYIKLVLMILSAVFYCIGMNLWGLNYTVQTAFNDCRISDQRRDSVAFCPLYCLGSISWYSL